MTLGKKIRFEILKRDGHTCRYCGGKPPHVTLEVDHVIAKAQGGSDQPENLVTSCFDCNRGKGKNGLGASILVARDLKAERKARRVAKELQKLDAEKDAEIKAKCIDICRHLVWRLGAKRDGIQWENFKYFATNLEYKDFSEAADITEWKLNKLYDENKMTREGLSDFVTSYFCGICHNKIKQKKNGGYRG